MFRPSPSPIFPVALKQPTVLARLLTYLDWPALHALLDTSTLSRNLFRDPALLDVILTRFVPGYEACRDPALNLDNLVPVDIHHLHLFLTSQDFAVHLYPTYALRTLFGLHPDDHRSEPLASLTQAHSRFTLLLQSLVHSSPNFTIPPEPAHAHLFEKLSPSLPEITSPAPLSYKLCSPSVSPQHPFRSKSKLRSGSTGRLSLLKSRSPPPPAPAAEPHALRVYSWRRSVARRPSSDSENELVPPRRRYVSSTPTSNTNSLTSLSRTSTPTPPTSMSSSSLPPSRTLLPLSTPSPYDFAHATSPTRAPVLRVYVPCTSPTPHPQTIIRCEEQLINAELWTHLSVGDIVVNLGHMPISDESDATPSTDRRHSLGTSSSSSPPPSAQNWLIFNGTFLVPFSAAPAAPVPVPDALTLPSPFYYTHILPRLTNPVFALRRMPQFSVSRRASLRTGLCYAQPAMPPGANDIHMRLVPLPGKVLTSHKTGAAIVRRYKWIALVFVHAPMCVHGVDGEQELELGVGWQGEWILEGDGTKEGREALVDWLVGRGRGEVGKGKGRCEEEWEWEWELVRERCGKGRIWLKLLEVRRCAGGIITMSGEGGL